MAELERLILLRPQNCEQSGTFETARNSMTKTLKSILVLATAALILGQAVTAKRPAMEPKNRGLPLLSNSEATRVLARACGDCHSDRTDWPWYSHVAPVSWWIAQHVREGRKKLDLSKWERYSSSQKHDKLESICGLISTGRMPPWQYAAMHPEAHLTAEDKQAVCSWVKEETTAAR